MVNNFGVDENSITAETISATISSEMQSGAIKAILVSTVLMLLYIWFRFKDIRFGASSVIALLHATMKNVVREVKILLVSVWLILLLTISSRPSLLKWMVSAKKADFNEIADRFGIDPVVARIIRNRDVVGEEAPASSISFSFSP